MGGWWSGSRWRPWVQTPVPQKKGELALSSNPNTHKKVKIHIKK
jgi:hypothetical protein